MSGFGMSQSSGFLAVGKRSMSKVRKYLDYFSLQVLKQDFILKREYSYETIAMAVVWASRKAAKFQPSSEGLI